MHWQFEVKRINRQIRIGVKGSVKRSCSCCAGLLPGRNRATTVAVHKQHGNARGHNFMMGRGDTSRPRVGNSIIGQTNHVRAIEFDGKDLLFDIE